jgi:hypothetical protein
MSLPLNTGFLHISFNSDEDQHALLLVGVKGIMEQAYHVGCGYL